MAETIPGGAYLAADGKTLVDSEGRPLSAEAQAQAEERAAAKDAEAAAAAQAEQAQKELAAGALRNLLGVSVAPAAVASDDDEAGKTKRGAKK